MRIAVFLCASVVCWLSGCASTHREAYPAARQQWRALCAKMPQGCVEGGTIRGVPGRVGPGRRLALERIAASALRSVVRVKTAPREIPNITPATTRPYGVSSRSGGSGVVIAADGLILTNEHVVRRAEHITVVLHDGRECPVHSVVVHPWLDLAVLRIDSDGLNPLVPAQASLKPQDAVVAVSAEVDCEVHLVRSGVLTKPRVSLQRELDPSGRRAYKDLLESTVSLEPGFSGGPLLTTSGAFVGINVAATGQEGRRAKRGYAIAFDERNREAIQLLARAADR
ncbi:MAG: S1C family serine protease [Phycisphaerae bacterium]